MTVIQGPDVIHKVMELRAHQAKLRKWAEVNQALRAELKDVEDKLMVLALHNTEEGALMRAWLN
jgi:hypothetical protein